MKKINLLLAGAFGSAMAPGSDAQQGPIPIAGLVELAGTGATAGTNFDNGVTIRVKDTPGVLLDVHFDNNGDMDRESFLVKVEGGKQLVTATLAPVSPIK